MVDVVIGSDGRAVMAWHDDDLGRIVARRETEAGDFGTETLLREDGEPRLPGGGAISLAAGGTGAVHAAYQWAVLLNAAALSYSVLERTWSAPRTVDNNAFEPRMSGVGVDVTLVGTTPVVAYLDWRDGIGDVRLATVRGGGVMPEVTLHMTGVAVADPPSDHPIEIATDTNGWLHLLVADASGGETILQYHRQTPSPWSSGGSSTPWPGSTPSPRSSTST